MKKIFLIIPLLILADIAFCDWYSLAQERKSIGGSAIGNDQIKTWMQQISADEAYKIAKDAYIYAYPLMLIYETSRQATNYEAPTGIVTQGPYNQFTHARQFTPVDLKIVVRPNVNTLYSSANLDLGQEPMVLSVPASDRYFHLPLLSFWTDVFAVPGTRTTGANTARDFLVVGPKWVGQAPGGIEIIRSPTRYVAIIGRTQTNGAQDYDAVHKIQDGYKLTPLSAWGKGDYVPPKHTIDPSIDMKTLPPVIIANMDAGRYFGEFADLLNDNPPMPCDYPIIHRIERIGFVVGQKFDLSALPEKIRDAFAKGAEDGKKLVKQLAEKETGAKSKTWAYSLHSGAYGVDYNYRAAVAYFGLGENLPEDAVYPALSNDVNGNPLNGNNKYALHFNKGKFPPVDAFWSITAYDAEGYLIPNSLKRYSLGSYDKFSVNADGSLDIYIQAGDPGDLKTANWLPVLKSRFTLMLRLYSPKEEFLEGNWIPPGVRIVK
jgi:hypothetical protein